MNSIRWQNIYRNAGSGACLPFKPLRLPLLLSAVFTKSFWLFIWICKHQLRYNQLNITFASYRSHLLPGQIAECGGTQTINPTHTQKKALCYTYSVV
jgi:hypothetical protein